MQRESTTSLTDFAPRYKLWPPEGYSPPTDAEFTELRRTAARHFAGGLFTGHWRRMGDDKVARHLQLVEICPLIDRQNEKGLYDYAHELRREMNRRGLAHESIRILRCQSCTHASERLFEATQATHPGMENRHGALIESAWHCACCWSGGRLGDEPADE